MLNPLIAEGTNDPAYHVVVILGTIYKPFAALKDFVVRVRLQEVHLSIYLSIVSGSVCRICLVSCL